MNAGMYAFVADLGFCILLNANILILGSDGRSRTNMDIFSRTDASRALITRDTPSESPQANALAMLSRCAS
ncbi:MAG: hypothetical protein R3C05_10390 [Pirellulaceae bacterium]